MEFRQFISQHKTGFEAVLLQEGIQCVFSFALYLTVVTAQNGLNLSLCLGRRDEIDPRRTDVLRLGCENLYLITTLQLMAQWH